MTRNTVERGPDTPVPGPPLGEVNFYAPSDWLDLLADPNDEGAVQARFRELTRIAFPNLAQDVQESVADAVMNTRRTFLDDGMLSCGLVTLPQTEDGPVLWQICSGVVEVETLDADLDIGSVFTRYLGQELTGRDVYLENFPTAIGSGLGLISTPQVLSDGSVELFPKPESADRRRQRTASAVDPRAGRGSRRAPGRRPKPARRRPVLQRQPSARTRVRRRADGRQVDHRGLRTGESKGQRMKMIRPPRLTQTAYRVAAPVALASALEGIR